MHIWKPIFYQSEVVAFSVGHIHNTDVGGAVPASLSRSLSEVHQEGIRIPPTKILTKEGINQEILDIFFKNVRAPEQNWGDLKAQIAACNTGERKVQEMIKRFGIETFREGIPELLNYAENQARAIVRNLPNGKYEFWDYIDEDAVNGWPCRIKLTLVIEDETLLLDFTGSDPQLESSMNIPTGGDPRHVLVLVGVVYVLYSLNPKLYLNSGITRICKCILPSGTMVNPEFPAAVGMRTLSCNRLHGLTFGAFAQAAPERLMGAPASGGPIMNVNTTDIKTGRRIMAAINPMTGGSGGCADGDGNDGSGANQGFLKNTPTEVNEVEAGILVHRYGLMKNSAGPGKHRGGLGTEMVFEALAPNTKITARNRDRTRFAGWGIVGGKAGAVSAFVRNPGKTNQINLGNTDIVTVDPGDIIYVSCGGAGGWGPPTERDPKAVLHDFKCGWITKQHAREIYGVIISEGSVDKKATTACREIKKSESNHNPSDGFYNVSVSQQDFEKVWTKQNYEKLTEGLAKLPISWRFFAKHQIFSAIAKMPDNDPSKLDGAAVQTEFNTLLRRFPDLRNRTEA